MRRLLILTISLLFLSQSAFAVTALKGLAEVRLVSKNLNVELEQATIIEGPQAYFQGLNDMGGEVFEATFKPEAVYFSVSNVVYAKKSSLKPILSLPLTRDEFLAILKYEKTESFEEGCGCGDETSWQHKKYKKMKINFSEFALINPGEKFPRHVRIEYKKNYFDLQWLTLETK